MALSIAGLVSFGFFLTSLFWWPWAYVPFEIPKVFIFGLFIKVLAICCIVFLLKKKSNWKVNKPISILLILFFVWSLISSFFGSDIVKSLLGNYFRKDGLLTLIDLIAFSFFLSFFWKENFKKYISFSIFFSSLILSVVAIVEILTNKFGLGSSATFGNPVFLAGYLALTLPFSYYLFRITKRAKLLIFLGLMIVFSSLILIKVTAAILTVLLFLLLVIIFQMKNKFKYILFVLMFILGLFIFMRWLNDFKDDYIHLSRSEGRVRIFRNLGFAIALRPLIGYGWANVDYAFEKIEWPLITTDDIYLDKAHSEILEISVTTGIIGLVIYLVIVALVLKKSIKKMIQSKNEVWEFTMLSVLILYLFHSQTNIISIVEQMFFWFVVGINLKK